MHTKITKILYKVYQNYYCALCTEKQMTKIAYMIRTKKKSLKKKKKSLQQEFSPKPQFLIKNQANKKDFR